MEDRGPILRLRSLGRGVSLLGQGDLLCEDRKMAARQGQLDGGEDGLLPNQRRRELYVHLSAGFLAQRLRNQRERPQTKR